MTKAATELPQVMIYTDGACSPNPGPGGWGAIHIFDGRPAVEISGFGGETTNNRMELTAVVQALSTLKRSHRVTLYTDSQYVKNGITSWIKKWQKNNWQTADRKPVKNVDLWQTLLDESNRHEVSWKWIRGHTADKWNERADELAVSARKTGSKITADPQTEQRVEQGDRIHLYTGVTCKHSTGVGSWVVILEWRHHIKIMGQRVTGMTANQLYIKAVVEGLSGLTKQFPVEVHTYSGYLRDGAASWLAGWKKRNWRTREGTLISNREHWQELSDLLDKYDVIFTLDNRENPLCHMLEAKELAREYEQVVHV